MADTRDNLVVDGIPIIWRTNLADDEIKELYSLIEDDPDFVVSGVNADSDNTSVKINLFSKEIPFKDGMCFCMGVNNYVNAIYKSYDDWKIWENRQRELNELRDEQADQLSAQKLLFETENTILLDQLDTCISNRNHKIIKIIISQLLKLRQDNLPVKRFFLYEWSFEDELLNKLAIAGDIDSAFFLIEQISEPFKTRNWSDHFQTMNKYLGLASVLLEEKQYKFDVTTFNKIEGIFEKALQTHPDKSTVYREICLFWSKSGFLKYSLKYCNLALEYQLDNSDRKLFERRKRRILKEIQENTIYRSQKSKRNKCAQE